MELDTQNDRIVRFNEQEQADFNVLPEVSAYVAVRTAVVFNYVAKGLVQRAIEQDQSQAAGRQWRNNLLRKAARLSSFSASVFELCPDEHLQVVTEGLTGSE